MHSSTASYGLEDLERLCLEKTEESAVVGEEFQLAWPPGKRKKWDLRDWEIEWFLRGYYDYSLFDLKVRCGRRYPKWPNGCPHVSYAGDIMAVSDSGEPLTHEFLVAWEKPIARIHPHEYLTQFSAAAELVGEYGQPADRLLAEADCYAIDLAIFDGPRHLGKPVIAAEIKLTGKKHDALVEAIRKCRGTGLTKDTCPARQDYRKCLWIRRNRTVKYLWVRSQEKSELFEVIRGGDECFDLSDKLSDLQMQNILSRQDWT